MKKIFGLLGGIALVALSVVSISLAFTQEQQEAYQWAYKYGLTTQPTIEKARMNSPLTRQAFAKMVVNYLENVVGVKQFTTNSCYFMDETKITDNLVPYTKKACAYQIMGSDGRDFNPSKPIDRAQLGTVFSRILWGDKHNSNGKGYYIYHVNALQDAGIMKNINNIVGVTAKRGDVLIMFKRMYEKFGPNVYLNNGDLNSSSLSSGTIIQIPNRYEDPDNDYISTIYDNSKVVYTSKDGTKYYYDDKFLRMLKNVAEIEGEGDLADYLKIESEYFKDGLNQLTDLDDEELLETMGIDTDTIDPDNMTKEEKQELIKKFKSAFGKIIDENKDKNNKLVDDLGKITKNIDKDKFGLKEKYKKTKTFIEASNDFLDVYSETMLDLMEIALMKEDGGENNEEGLAQAFGLIGIALAYQGTAEEYQQYVENWAVDTVKILDISNPDKNSKNDSEDRGKSETSLIFFYGDTCPYCETEASYLLELQDEYQFDIKGYNVYKNAENAEMMMEYSNRLGTTFNGVPVVIMGDEYVVGAQYNKTLELIDKYATKK